MRFHVTALLIALGFSTGCSSKPSMVPVSGRVTLNGKPVESCQVCFYPDVESPDPERHGYGLAWTDADGKYTLANSIGETGIFPGKYKVVLVSFVDKNGKILPKTAKPSETPGGFFNQMPKEYEDYLTSPETVEVPRAGLSKDFDILK